MIFNITCPSTGLQKPVSIDDEKKLTERVVDDILDEGYTLQELIAYCQAKGAKKVLSAVLLKKKLSNIPTSVRPDFIGLEVADRYVFGWGMDYKGYLRNLSSIYAIASSDWPKVNKK